MQEINLLDIIRTRSYLIEIFEGKPFKWLTPIIHFKFMGFKPFLSIIWRVPFLRDNLLKIDWECRERVVENTWIYRWLDNVPDRAKILDIGCAESPLSFELASMGYKVVGIDLRNYPLTHPNLNFVIGDIFRLPFLSSSFDFVSAISTVEHLGISTWGIPASSKEDIDGINEIYRCLKHNGFLFLTVPFGKKNITWQRIYDYKSLRRLLQKFNIISCKYYKRVEKKYWIEVQRQELENIPSLAKDGVNGVAIFLCKKG